MSDIISLLFVRAHIKTIKFLPCLFHSRITTVWVREDLNNKLFENKHSVDKNLIASAWQLFSKMIMYYGIFTWCKTRNSKSWEISDIIGEMIICKTRVYISLFNHFKFDIYLLIYSVLINRKWIIFFHLKCPILIVNHIGVLFVLVLMIVMFNL